MKHDMIDWLVLLTPLILLAIFLLFVFLGCESIGGTSDLTIVLPVKFTYVGGLQDNVLSIDWTFDTTKLTYESSGPGRVALVALRQLIPARARLE